MHVRMYTNMSMYRCMLGSVRRAGDQENEVCWMRTVESAGVWRSRYGRRRRCNLPKKHNRRELLEKHIRRKSSINSSARLTYAISAVARVSSHPSEAIKSDEYCACGFQEFIPNSFPSTMIDAFLPIVRPTRTACPIPTCRRPGNAGCLEGSTDRPVTR